MGGSQTAPLPFYKLFSSSALAACTGEVSQGASPHAHGTINPGLLRIAVISAHPVPRD